MVISYLFAFLWIFSFVDVYFSEDEYCISHKVPILILRIRLHSQSNDFYVFFFSIFTSFIDLPFWHSVRFIRSVWSLSCAENRIHTVSRSGHLANRRWTVLKLYLFFLLILYFCLLLGFDLILFVYFCLRYTQF